MNNSVPTGWSLQPLSALAHYYNGRAFKPEDWSSEGLPIIRIAQINNKNTDLDYYAGDDVSDKNRIINGDLLFSWSATLTALIWNRGDAVLNQHIFKVEEKAGVDRKYLHQVILNSIEPLADYSHGSTMKHIKKGVLDEYCVGTPPLSEQQKIATILSSVDDVIEKTCAQINKLKDLKTGMMQELLTKGIGHTEFKDSPVGQIPRSWDVVSVGSLTDVIDPQPDHRTPAEVIDGVPYVGLGDIGKSGLIDFSAARKVSQEAFEKQKEGFEIHPGAFIFGKIGTIGKPYVLPTERFYCLSANVVLVTTKKSINMKYLFQVFGSEIIDQQVLLQTNTTSQPALGIKKVRDFLVPYPKQCEEVELITEVLASVDNRISRVNDKLAHQLDLKKALMQDLLTGKVRVNLTDKESAVV